MKPLSSAPEKILSCSDSDLVTKILNGESTAFELVMRRYNQRLFRVARSIVKDENRASELLQDAYIKAYKALPSFKGPNGFFSWLSRIVTNEALMYLRKNGKKLALTDSIDEPSAQHQLHVNVGKNPDRQFENAQLRELLEDAIDRLPAVFSSVFVLHNIEEFSVREIAETLGIEEATVKTRNYRAKKILQTHFKDKLQIASADVFEFAGKRCDHVVAQVFQRLHLLN